MDIYFILSNYFVSRSASFVDLLICVFIAKYPYFMIDLHNKQLKHL